MKISIPLTIVTIICIMALERIEAFNATIGVFVFYSQCKVWATDNSGNTVMDTGWMNCEKGDPESTFHSRDVSANPYYLHAKVMGSTRKTKHRGPFDSDTCFRFRGNSINWRFDKQDMSYCNGNGS
ncbi:unnamed protein product [Rhizophagus irregularis]|uniref:Uncharacterized protein n=1 Tax=Rhizophagus irregularis TaxID=588596 RepID=A0A2I1H8S4_9GLOM|nr:hypothetical protein RhiirA4_474617 [Rhizophagus irregularis]CAB4408114.1 unnamed protein product [Rhizophagus irregularis]